MVRTRPKRRIPLFEMYTVGQLVKLTPYSWAYLESIRVGSQEARPQFIKTMTRLFHMTEKELFTTPEE